MYDENDPASVERYSSAITLSDMEVFIFPELLYALMLANVMSPRLWQWRDDAWFSGDADRSSLRRMQRLRQYVMDHFIFNLDLDTWGLTTKEKELARFSTFVDPEALAKSNALFGYEGDKYYFSSDIRKHFGLDKYDSNVIPYWKTETLEAMEAFRHKQGYATGAGECVSLSTLYAAAAHVVAGVPLDDIFLMATPLHSQNFIDIGDGVLTNNRRLVTRAMWFNGSEISGRARRALENEQVTIVSHRTGCVHSLYRNASMDPAAYGRFAGKLRAFCSIDITFEILANFLRWNSKLQRCFQIDCRCGGKPRYIEAEKVFAYEHNSKSRVSDNTREKLLHEIEEDEFYPGPIPGRLMLSELERFFKTTRVSPGEPDTIEQLKRSLHHACYNVDQVIIELLKFCRTEPRLPQAGEKTFTPSVAVDLSGAASQAEALDRIGRLAESNETCRLAFAAFRDLARSPWKPFVKAAMERNPVSVAGLAGVSLDDCYSRLAALPGESVYPGPNRVAQPDEVWNFGRGDGLEKALALANVIRAREPEALFAVERNGGELTLHHHGGKTYAFASRKTVAPPEEKDFC